MYPITQRFRDALYKSHTVVSKVDLLRFNQLLVPDIPVISGSVTDDSSAAIRRRCSLAITPTDAMLALLGEMPEADGGLWPLGNELKLYGGIRFAEATSSVPADDELVPLGVYRISRPQLSEDGTGEASFDIEGFDRSRAVSRAKFTKSYKIANGTNTADAIENIIRTRLPWMVDLEFEFMVTTDTTPGMVLTYDDDPWEIAQELALGMGAEVYFNGDGKCVLRPAPIPTYGEADFEYAVGEASILLSTTRDLDDEEAYNGIIMVSENSDIPKPLRSEVWDTDPTSPTYYDPAYPTASAYGPVPLEIKNDTITTQAKCNEAAAIELRARLGIVDHVDFTAINNPAHESGDTVKMYHPRIGVNCTCLLESVNIGLGHDFQMSGSTRQRSMV